MVVGNGGPLGRVVSVVRWSIARLLVLTAPWLELCVRAARLPSLLSRQGKEEHAEAGYSRQQLILGTHTSEGEQNYLMRADVQLPLEDSETDVRCVGHDGVGLQGRMLWADRDAGYCRSRVGSMRKGCMGCFMSGARGDGGMACPGGHACLC